MKQKILIIGFVWPEPKSSAAGTRMMQLIDLFLTNKYEITFVSTAQNFEFSENLNDLGVKTKIIILNSTLFDDFIKELNPSIVLFDRFMTEEQFGWRVSEHCPNAIQILDLEDLHCLRLARQQAVKENSDFSFNDLFSDTAKREIASVLRCDLTLVISDFEMELLESHFTISKQLLFYLPLFAKKHIGTINEYNDREDFVFIGNFLHEPNWDCVQYLSKDIWPKIHAVLPEAKMKIYGAYTSQKVMQLQNKKTNFFIEGRAKDVATVFLNAKVLLVPLRFGAGIKGKLLEAMQYGLPSVTSCIGTEGLQSTFEWNGSVEEESGAFSKAAISLFENETNFKIAQQNGYDILKSRFEKSYFKNDFFKKIIFIQGNLVNFRNQNFIGQILLHQSLASTKYMSKWIEEKNKKNPEI